MALRMSGVGGLRGHGRHKGDHANSAETAVSFSAVLSFQALLHRDLDWFHWFLGPGGSVAPPRPRRHWTEKGRVRGTGKGTGQTGPSHRLLCQQAGGEQAQAALTPKLRKKACSCARRRQAAKGGAGGRRMPRGPLAAGCKHQASSRLQRGGLAAQRRQ